MDPLTDRVRVEITTIYAEALNRKTDKAHPFRYATPVQSVNRLVQVCPAVLYKLSTSSTTCKVCTCVFVKLFRNC
jgi:ferredoxin-like protein FixX